MTRYGIRDKKVGRKKPLMHVTSIGFAITAEPHWMHPPLAMTRDQGEAVLERMGWEADLYELFELKEEADGAS